MRSALPAISLAGLEKYVQAVRQPNRLSLQRTHFRLRSSATSRTGTSSHSVLAEMYWP